MLGRSRFMVIGVVILFLHHHIGTLLLHHHLFLIF
jgi:hypothetical protein